MTAPREQQEDGALRPALQALQDAVHALCGPQSHVLEGKLVYVPSRYLQLADAIPGQQGSQHGAHARSMPPLWLDAADLINEIDNAAECWQPAFQGVPATVGRFRTIVLRGWRPQDVRQLEQITAALLAWVSQIDALLTPSPKWTLPNPCPACNTATVYRRDSGGEMVRQPALQIGPNGCQCQRCKHIWEPAYFQHLASVLGYSLPPGVLE